MNHLGEPHLALSGNGSPSLSDRVRSLRLDGRDGGRPPRGGVLAWALCVILLMTSAALGYRTYRATPSLTPAPGETSQVQPTAPTTSASAGSADSGEVALQQKGYVIPVHQVQVSPKVGGMIVWINEKFEEGARFKEGDVLARLEDVDYKAEKEHARQAWLAAIQRREEMEKNRKEEIDQAREEWEESKKTLRQMDLDLERNRRLMGTVALSQSDYEKILFGRDAMAARVRKLKFAYDLMNAGARKERREAADADKRAAEADLAKAQWRLDNCQIKAPISGTILTKKAEKGNIVNPAAYSSGISASLCDMADLRDLEIDLTVQERDIALVEPNQPCLVMPEAYQNHKPFLRKHPRGYPGYVSRIMPIADRSKGAVPVRVRIRREDIPEQEAGVFLKPDMGVLVSFLKKAS